jgi:colanic acid biosynthesis glycosyl transferase WcaI
VTDDVPAARPLAGRSVLILSIYYAPEQTGIAPYTTQIAEHLVERGARVTAITGMPHYPSWRLDRGYRNRLRSIERRAGVDLVRLRHFVPRRQSAARRALYETTYLLQALTARPRFRPDVVLAVIPNLGCGVAAAVHAKRFGIPLVVLVQDLAGSAAAQSGIQGGQAVANVTSGIEGRVLRAATRVAVLNDAFRKAAERMGVVPSRIVSLPNWSHMPLPAADREVTRARLGWPTGTVVALHAGNMGLKQDLGNVVEAARLAAAEAVDVRFVLMGDGSQRSTLEEASTGVTRVEFRDACYGQDYADVLAAADVLLVNERDSVKDMSLPSKLTSYFLSGRPIVAAVNNHGTTAFEVKRSGGGVVVTPGEPSVLLKTCVQLGRDGTRARALGARGRDYASQALDRKRALQRLEKILDDAQEAAR